ncbi:MAG: polysaccharide deacetylase family protein [Clostridia bacterium]|nr:polysaccharide deacetylase family protein [Clostridia bacterium]
MKIKKRKIILPIIISIIAIIIIIGVYITEEHRIAVLCYHNIATTEEKQNFLDEQDWTITVENFEEQLKYLQKNNYKTLTMQEFYKWKQGEINLPYKSVLITFDDGFLSNYQYAFPLLKKYNMNATVFIVGSFIDNSTDNEWQGNIKTYMSNEILEKVKKEYPNIEIYSHSYNLHYQGAINRNTEELKNDIETFNSKFENIDIYCYPFGQYNYNMKQALKEENYKMAFKYGPDRKDYKKASRKDDDFEIPRLNVSHGMSVNKFAIRLMMY